MPDMLVRLYDLPRFDNLLDELAAGGIDIRRGIVLEKNITVRWVAETFSIPWANECEAAYGNKPVSCFLAVENETIVGFACYDATCKDFFGPTGVLESHRRRGIGKALLLRCLRAMYEQGYGYAIIGAAGPVAFYEKHCGAVVIEGSRPGVYRGVLRQPPAVLSPAPAVPNVSS